MDCSICCEKFNKSNHFKVECKGCNEDHGTACRKCCQTFILGATQDPACMFCKSPWDREFMNKSLTKKFVEKDLKEFSENLFVEQQISLLPETQKDAIKEKKIRELQNKVTQANLEKDRIVNMLKEQNDIIKAFELQIQRMRNGTSTEDTSVKNFTVKCPTKNCNGFLDDKHFCSLCDTKYCKHCMEVLCEDHVCDEATKATIKAIKKEAKPCPGCGEMISKIDGCDQMWCTQCHIQFSWRTGEQMTGYNHNPEYFRYLRETGQEIARNPLEQRQVLCGVDLNGGVVTRIINQVFGNNLEITKSFQNLYAFYRHVEHHLPFVTRDENNEAELRRLRVKYLLGELDKETWKKNLQQIDKKTKKLVATNNVWRLIQTVMQSYMERIVTYYNEPTKSREKFVDILKSAEKFRNYANESFLKVSNTFGSSTCPGIDTRWREVYNYKKHRKAVERM